MKNNIKLDENLTSKIATASKIATGDIVIKLNDNNNKSIFEIGNIKIYNIKRFSWLQRKMFRVFFGIKICCLENKGE